MKLRPLLAMLAVFSTSAFADVDYTRCGYAAGLYGTTLDNDGQLKLSPNQKLVNKTTEGKVEKYTVETNLSVYGGNYPASKSAITIERDDKGQVVKVILGGDKLDKKSIDSMNKMGLHVQATNAVMPFGLPAYNPYSNVFNSVGTEPVYSVKNKQGQLTYKNLTQLTKDERAQVGLSEDLYKEMTQNWKKDKKSMQKIEKGLKHFQDKMKPSYLIGQEAEFDIQDGVCTPRVAKQRFYNTVDGTIGTKAFFSKEACEEVSKLYEKHKEKLAKCDETNMTVSTDMAVANDKIKDLYNTATFGLGSGGLGFSGLSGSAYGGGMFGGYGTSSQLGFMKINCDAMVGQLNLNSGAPKEQSKSSSSSQQ